MSDWQTGITVRLSVCQSGWLGVAPQPPQKLMLLLPIFKCFYQSQFPCYLAICENSAFAKVSSTNLFSFPCFLFSFEVAYNENILKQCCVWLLLPIPNQGCHINLSPPYSPLNLMILITIFLGDTIRNMEIICFPWIVRLCRLPLECSDSPQRYVEKSRL